MGQNPVDQPPYEAPEIIVLGPVEELTLAGGQGMGDGDGSFISGDAF